MSDTTVTDTSTDTRPSVRVRPAWGVDAPPLSTRAARLLLAEWLERGLVTDDDLEASGPEALLRGIQERAGVAAFAPGRTDANAAAAGRLRLVTSADGGSALVREADWPTFEGVLLTVGEVAAIGRTADGRLVRERFLPGALRMPPGGAPPLLNRAHERARVIGHLTSVAEVDGQVQCRGVIVDTATDGHDAYELARAGSVSRLSVEFIELGKPHTQVSVQPDGSRLVEHSAVMLVGAALVPLGAYESARLTRLLDRADAGRQREHMRALHLAELREPTVADTLVAAQARRQDRERARLAAWAPVRVP